MSRVRGVPAFLYPAFSPAATFHSCTHTTLPLVFSTIPQHPLSSWTPSIHNCKSGRMGAAILPPRVACVHCTLAREAYFSGDGDCACSERSRAHQGQRKNGVLEKCQYEPPFLQRGRRNVFLLLRNVARATGRRTCVSARARQNGVTYVPPYMAS